MEKNQGYFTNEFYLSGIVLRKIAPNKQSDSFF